MDESVEVLDLRREHWEFGFVSRHVGWWETVLGRKGKWRWKEQSIENATRRVVVDPVHVLIVEDISVTPAAGSTLWDNLRLVLAGIYCASSARYRFPKSLMQKGWRFERKKVAHDEVGGVTNGSFTMWIAVHKSNPHFPGRLLRGLKRGVSSQLSHVTDPILSGFEQVQIPSTVLSGEMGELNWGNGLLDWNNLRGSVFLPTVYSKSSWCKRKLRVHELLMVLDLPRKHILRFPSSARHPFFDSVVPGKCVQALFQCMALPYSPIVEGANEKGGTRHDDILEKHLELTRTKEEAPISSTVTDKAVKSDDADVPVHLWDNRILELIPEESRNVFQRALPALRHYAHRYWIRQVQSSFLRWYAEHGRRWPGQDQFVWDRGMEAISHAKSSNWWNWEGGSSLFFWRWDESYLEDALFGCKPMFDRDPVPWFKRQAPIKNEKTREKVAAKVRSVVGKGYLKPLLPGWTCLSLMNLFDVPKGTDDIRLVYDGTKSGLNDSLWAPWFMLPDVDSMARSLMPGYWCADNDYGEQFLNFPLHADLRKYVGVDVTHIMPELADSVSGLAILLWFRNAMGLKPSPYFSVQGALRAKRLIMKGREDPKHPFHWKSVRLNLPGSHSYDCRLPWVMQLRNDKLIAAALKQYVDDLRTNAPTRELAWQGSSRIAKMCSWLGLQDAARKRREESQTPGAWAGGTVGTTDDQVWKSVTESRWNKFKSRVHWFAYMLALEEGDSTLVSDEAKEWKETTPRDHLPFKMAESYCGFLVYVSLTFSGIFPYLKGVYLTLNSWRPNRDDSGWPSPSRPDLDEAVDWSMTPQELQLRLDRLADQESAPKFVKVAARLRDDVRMLCRFCKPVLPRKMPVRPRQSAVAFLMGDASGNGFGSMLWSQGAGTLHTSHGTWSSEGRKESSNFREAYNLTERIHHFVNIGHIQRGSEIFIVTDNFVFESAFFNGRSKHSKKLHRIITSLKQLEMDNVLFIHVVWVAGTRMIDSGGDGLSRGDTFAGVMEGERDLLSYLPFNKTATERSPSLKSWVLGLSDSAVTWLTPEGWFSTAFEDPDGFYVWDAPPAAAHIALEQLCEVKHIHPNSQHIFLCPNLMTYLWRKRLGKQADAMVLIPVGCDIWENNQFESLHLGLILPLLNHRPWSIRRSPGPKRLADAMSGLQRASGSAIGSCLRQFLASPEQYWD